MTGGVLIPGSDLALDVQYDDRGELLRLAVGERVHVSRAADGAWMLGDGLAEVRELALARGLLRRVCSGGLTWTERYEWDDSGRPVRIDGVVVKRDAQGRLTLCRDAEDEWRYEYGPAGLELIRSPRGERRIARGSGGRPVRAREPGRPAVVYGYDADGRRRDAGDDPPGWERDPLGRLWTVRADDGDGAVRCTYLWAGMSCIGRIDGPADGPLAAAFLLDPTGTPVRVVTHDGMTRIPRDAFGEALLDHPDVPGLFGGPVHDGLVRLPARTLDPRVGAFDRPDPLDGLDDDPRRAAGFTGLLPVNLQPSGTYSVCRDDPVARTDPSGGISAGVLPITLSSLTWSSQYNILNFVFLQLFANLLQSLFTTDDDGRWNMRRFFSIEGIASQRGGGFGFRIDPAGLAPWIALFAGQARGFTVHHVFWSRRDDEGWDGLRVIRMFAPLGDFAPSCYGTILRAEPGRARRFVLRGAHNAPPLAVTPAFPPPDGETWTRHGGVARPVFPGSRVPRFPAGGIHFSLRSPVTGVPPDIEPDVRKAPEAVGPQTGRLVELAPDGALAQGTVAEQTRLRLPRTGLKLAANAAVLVSLGTAHELHQIASAPTERDGATWARLTREVALVSPSGLRVRGAKVASTSESLPAGATADRLDARAPASTVRYASGDVLRLVVGAADPIAAEVSRLEVRLTLDAALPTDLRHPLEVFLGSPSGAAHPVTRTSATELEFPAGQDAPGVGDAVVVAGGGAVAAVTVTAATDRKRTLDRALPAALADPLTWRPLARSRRLGRAPAPATGSGLEYVPEVSGQAPDPGAPLLLVSGSSVAARSVATRDADEVVLSAPLAGAAAGTAVTVARVALGDPDVTGASLQTVQALTLAPAADRSGRTLRLHQLTTQALAPGPLVLVQSAGRDGDGVAVALPASGGELPLGDAATPGPTPGQLVVLQPDSGPGPLPAVVRHVRLTASVDRRLTFPAAETAALAAAPPPPGTPLMGGLAIVPLLPAGPTYLADQLGPRAVLIRPEVVVGGVAEPVEFSRPRVDDILEIEWQGSAGARLHRVRRVDGQVAILDAEGGALPINTPGLTVRRLDAADPGTGTILAGREGAILELRAAESVVRADVWQPDALPVGSPVAVTDGTRALPARVTARTRLEIAWHPASGLDPAATKVTITPPALATDPLLIPSVAQDGGEIVLDNVTGVLSPGTGLVVAVDYRDARMAVEGTYDAGSVLVPDEPAVELTRLQALIDHEMTHTAQAALWGPMLLSALPIRGIEELYEAAAGEPYPQVLHDIGKTWSVGGLMNLVTSSVVSGLAWVVFKVVSFLVRLFSGQPLSFGWLGHADWLPFHPATIPDATQPRRIRLAAAGQPALSSGDLVEVTSGSTYRRANVSSVAGDLIELDAPAPAGGDLQVALVAEDDDTSRVEHAVMRATGFGALEEPFDAIFDPWNKLASRGAQTPGSFEDVLFRAARDLFGSSSWTLFPLGYFLFDNGLRNRAGKGHLSKMEQSASGASGENYSAIGRLDGTLEVVGDVARYWHFVEWRHHTALLGLGGDAPGVQQQDLLRVVPSARIDTALPVGAPNEQMDGPPRGERPGAQVADVFVEKDPADPLATATPGPNGFRPSPRGSVPVSQRVERCVGTYVAFTRPPAVPAALDPQPPVHRVTSADGFPHADTALDAQKEGKQTILFDRAVRDVEVTIAGRPVAEGDRVQLVRGRRTTVKVSPGEDRRYALALLQPGGGAVVRLRGDLTLMAEGVNSVEPVEVCRVYRYDPATRHYDHPALDAHGVHLPDDVLVPVRRFEVEVVDTVPVLSSPDPRTPPLSAPAHAGDTVYVAVPVERTDTDYPFRRGAVTYPGGRPALVIDPSPTFTAHSPSADVLALMDGGVMWRVGFPVADPPEAPALVELTTTARLADGTGEVTCLVPLDPWFTLDAGAFSVARGARLSLTCSGGVTPGTVAVTPAAGVTATITGATVDLDVNAAAAPGAYSVLVTDAAQPVHRSRRSFRVT